MLAGAADAIRSLEASRVHIASRRRGCGVASCGDSPDCAAPTGRLSGWRLHGDSARASPLAEELFRLKPDVLVAGTTPGVIAFKELTNTVPIVSQTLVDPIGLGLAASHARPGGNVTGVLSTVEDLPSKQLALAVEMVPGARKIGLLANPGNPSNEAQRSNVEVGAA